MKKTIITIFVLILLFILLAGGVGVYFLIRYYRANVGNNNQNGFKLNNQSLSLKKFKNEAEFKEYYSSGQSNNSISNFSYLQSSLNVASDALAPSTMLKSESTQGTYAGSSSDASVDRYSSTNVQVSGIDEPDIVKTNGQEIFFSPSSYFYDVPIFRGEDVMTDQGFYPGYQSPKTRVIQALPADKLAELSQIDANGDLLLVDDILIILSGNQKITAYNIADPTKPNKLWEYTLDNNSSLFQARVYDQQLYVVALSNMYSLPNCPIPLLSGQDSEIKIACTDIYHPTDQISTDSVYTILKLNSQDGAVLNQTSLLGSASLSTIYMSPENLYLTYQKTTDPVKLFFAFISENKNLFSTSVYQKIQKIQNYDLSDQAKLVELGSIVSNYFLTLDSDERTKLENDLENATKNYLEKNKRTIFTTQINKISLSDFSVAAIGEVPGQPLNQFALDEYQNNLRIATTVGRNFWSFPFSSSNLESVNDVYVLDKNLKITGQIQDLGVGERIYSVRFLSDLGYVVTFKETDPFYVLDLSDPNQPIQTGELKIPGYSSYLHPISDKLVLGIGKEDSNVKVSLFDVSDPAKPNEIAKYSLKDYWSDILNNHHAFLLDDKHQIFFLPGSNAGYIFSYQDNQLTLIKAISDISARRAIYINNNLYIVGDSQIKIYDETNWSELNTLEIK